MLKNNRYKPKRFWESFFFGQKDKPFVTNRIIRVPISSITLSLQIRKRFDEVSVLALADSIRQHGLLQPVLVRRAGKGMYEKTHYVCVAGEKRLRACQMLGWDEIPCLILLPQTNNLTTLALTENLIRSDLDMFELADGFEALTKQELMPQEKIAACLSTSKRNVARKNKLLKLTPNEQKFILANHLTERHALALLRIEDTYLRMKVAHLIAERHYTAERTEEYIDIIVSDLLPFAETLERDDNLESFDKSLSCSLSLLHKNGYAAQCEKFEHENEIQFLVRIPKK